MKKLLFGFATLFFSAHSFAQTNGQRGEITYKDSWLKAGVEASIPVGPISNFSSFAAGVDLSGQFMNTRHFGLGITTGYTEFFGKNGADGFGDIPAGVMLRYYCRPAGFFAGFDVGYSFLTGNNTPTGGLYLKPQIGYHNYNWNFYGFYNQVFVSDATAPDVQNIGIAASYNIRFKK
ncbi:MAG TPA: hypothetical protein VK718_05365 [Ferruginibacter sp.]|jgi:hypothetical protein|nr:hypothetical protein [Ferruginibacter sp.]